MRDRNWRGQTYDRIIRHCFSAEIEAEIRGLNRLDNWHAPLALISDVAWVAAAALAVSATGGRLGLVVYLLVAVPIIAARQRALATLLHEAAHGTLARNRRLNRFIGTYCSGYLVLQTFTGYLATHVKLHHAHFGDPERDPDLRSHLRMGLYDTAGASTASAVWTCVFRPILRSFAAARYLLTDRFLNEHTHRPEALRALVYNVAVGGVVAWFIGWERMVLFWYGPLFVAFPALNWIIELLEHYPLPCAEYSSVYMARHRAVGPISRHFVGIHNEGYHLDHHLSPRVPFWNLPRVHDIRMEDTAYRAAIESTAAANVVVQLIDAIKSSTRHEPPSDLAHVGDAA